MPLTPLELHMLAAIVTSLEMTERPRPRALPHSPFRLVAWAEPAVDAYRTLFTRVGAPWLWFSRLVMDDTTLGAIIRDPAVEVHAIADPQGLQMGMLELDFREAGVCELSFVGFVPEFTGKGHGSWLIAQALTLAWREGIKRVWVHTCTLDHPAALRSYIKAGFHPFARAIETFVDPRIAGVLPRDAAPQIPLLAS